MLDAAAFFGKLVYHTLRRSLPVLADAATGRLTDERVNQRMRAWARAVVDAAGLRLDVRGAEQVDWSRAYVVMSNHQSHLDIPALVVATPGALRFVAKRELRHLPFFGPAMVVSGVIFIDRKNRRRAVESLKAAKDIVARGLSIWIAPEGTRSRTGAIGPLKKGGFMIALDTQTPILPVVVSGTRDALPANSRNFHHGADVRIEFGQPIPVAGSGRDALVAQVDRFFRDHI